jgi:hypothetical protein
MILTASAMVSYYKPLVGVVKTNCCMKKQKLVAAHMILSLSVILFGILGLVPTLFLSSVYGTNESSYKYGFFLGNGQNLNENNELLPGWCSKGGNVTNSTACLDSFSNGWKNWCSNNAKDCVGNFTLGEFPEMILSAHQQYLAGKKAGQNYGDKYFICPGSNQAFCQGYSESVDEINNGGGDCANQNFTGNFIGCPFDYVKSVAGFPMLFGGSGIFSFF